MCGVAGFQSDRPRNLNEFRAILSEIGIRGRHSTGVAWIQDDRICVKKEQVPYDEFELPDVETTAAVFHTRYSTSYLDYPQPVCLKHKAVVHNGVITQAPYEEWERMYGFKSHYKCDSALLLKPQKHPLLQFRESSMAVIELTMDGLQWYRNEQRPLWMRQDDEGLTIVASTRRSLHWDGNNKWTETAVPNVLYPEGIRMIASNEDLQDVSSFANPTG